MLVVSDNFKRLMKAPVKTVRATVINKDSQAEYHSDDSLISVDIESVGALFNVATKQLAIKLLGTDYDLVDKTLTVRLEVYDAATNIWERVNLGNFKVTEQTVDKDKETTSLKAVDKVGQMALDKYSEGGLFFPCTVAELAEQLANKYSCTINADCQTLPNANYEITEDLYAKINNTTYRDILAEIAGATATIVQVELDNDRLTFKPVPKTIDDSWTWDNLRSIKLKDKYGAVNSVVIARTPAEDNIALKDDESISEIGLTEVKLANNEILDDDRETVIQSIFNAVNGFWHYPFEANTEGHGWHQVGDRIKVTNEGKSWEVMATSVKLTIDGGFKEAIKGEAPTPTTTNYALAGGITKTIYNTEIKVDKQGQNITSVVSKMDNLETQVINNYTEIKQDITNVTTSIQETGGANLIYNSVGYDIDNNGKLVDWEVTGTVSSATSPESITYGAVSGNQINLVGGSSIKQRVAVDNTGKEYSLSAKVKKGMAGGAVIKLVNSADTFSVAVPDEKATQWQEFSIRGIKPTENYLDVIVETDADVSDFAITDLMMNAGSSSTQWVQASGETLNTQVAITKNGVKVKSSVYRGDYVEITPLEFAGYSTASGSTAKVFSLNRDITKVQKLNAVSQIQMPPIKVVPITSGDRAGWAFVKIGGDN